MVELERGIYRRVELSVWVPLDSLRECERLGIKLPPFPDSAIFEDGRVGYFLLAEAGFPYLAYALFSMDEPRDRKEALLLRIRYAFDLIDRLKGRERPLEFHGFAYDIGLVLYFEDEVRRCVEWAERLTLEEVKAMLKRLLELARERELEPGLLIDPELLFYPDHYSVEDLARGYLVSLKNLAALLRWLLSEWFGVLRVTVLPRIDEEVERPGEGCSRHPLCATVELERGVNKRVGIELWVMPRLIEGYGREGREPLPTPDSVHFSNGRIGYFFLARAGFPYLAYALFSMDEPRDEKERELLRRRIIFEGICALARRRWPPRYYSFAYDAGLVDVLGDEVRRYIEWAEKLEIEDVDDMRRELNELLGQPEDRPENEFWFARSCFDDLKKLAALLRWLLDERTRDACILEVRVTRRVDEPDEVLPPWEM